MDLENGYIFQKMHIFLAIFEKKNRIKACRSKFIFHLNEPSVNPVVFASSITDFYASEYK